MPFAETQGTEAAIYDLWDDLKEENIDRDHRHSLVSLARRGDVEALMPGFFPKSLDKQMTANVINLASQAVGESVGTVPDINCKPDRFTSAQAKKSADIRTKIANGFAEYSRLAVHLPGAADRMATFGFMPFVVEADFEKMTPTIRVDNPVGAYYRMDHFGRVKCYFKRWFDKAGRLAAKFPEHADAIFRRTQTPFGTEYGNDPNTDIEVVKYYGADKTCLFLGEDRITLAEAPNPLGKLGVFIAERPQWDDEVRGQYDEMLWVQVARAFLATLSMEAAHKAVTAPMVLPLDVGTISFGPDATIRTSNPGGVGRVALDVPPAAFQENALLQSEERVAARFPEAASGSVDASIITGQGIEALLSTRNSQVSTMQLMVATALQDALSHAMCMDEMLFGDVEKYTEGRINGSTYSLRYTPSKHIGGDYAVECTYGFATGMDANRGLVFMLQALAAGLVDKDTVMRKLPFNVDPTEIAERIDIEQMSDAIKQGLFGLPAALPAMAQMGQDPREVLAQMAKAIEARQKGKSMHEAALAAFTPTKKELEAAQQAQAQDPMAAMLGAGSGQPVDPQLAQGAGSRPDVMSLIAGLTQSGNPNLQAGVQRMQSAS